MDDLIKQGKIKEMIVVIPNSLTFMLGSFYFNSTVRGNWEDYIVDDLVDYIDNNYRTISNANSRGIAGHSMGGFGALNLAMRHPDIYCATYGLSPGLFDKNGLKDQGMFSQSMMNQFLAKQEEWSKMDKYNAMAAFKEYINYLKLCHLAS
jgi:S-formylglutathione hydrolase FrmB